MKKLIFASLIFSLALTAAVYAQAPGDFGPGWGMGCGQGMGWGPGMGPGMMRGGAGPYGQPPCAAWTGPGSQITEDNAKAAAQQYADKYIKGYKMDRVLPFTGVGGGMTMFQARAQRTRRRITAAAYQSVGQRHAVRRSTGARDE